MARRDSQLREELRTILREAGAVITADEKTRGGHQVLRWTLQGRAMVSFYSGTASCRRTHANTVAMVRRQIREVQG